MTTARKLVHSGVQYIKHFIIYLLMKFSTQITALKHSLTIITLQIENNTIQQQYNSLYGAVSQETELLGC